MDTKLLRQKILDLAIHGKLVPQDPNDEPASVLLERIMAEKERLIKEGKIKAPKKSKSSDTSHYEKIEGPFEIPESWEWVRLGDISNYGQCENVDVSRISPESWTLELEDIEKDSAKIIAFQNIKKRPLKGVRHRFLAGDVLYSKLRTYLNKVLVAPKDGYCTTEIIPIKSYSGVSRNYMCYVLRSNYYLDYTSSLGFGVKMPRLSTNDAIKSLIPIPPYNEQIRIVKAIQDACDTLERIESAQENVTTQISLIKSKILSLAISGDLVPQDPNDEPAIELLKRVNPDFKPCDNSHYRDLPKGWSICTLYDICDTINGLWKGKNPPFVNVGVIRNANFTKDFNLDYSKIEYIDVEQRAFEKRNLEDGDLIVEKSGGSDNFPVGRSILYQGESGKYSFSNFTMALRIKDKNLIRSGYLYFVILHKYLSGEMTQMQTQTTGLHNLLSDKYMSMPIPIPPTKEQDRIIDGIEKLLNKMNKIKTAL